MNICAVSEKCTRYDPCSSRQELLAVRKESVVRASVFHQISRFAALAVVVTAVPFNLAIKASQSLAMGFHLFSNNFLWCHIDEANSGTHSNCAVLSIPWLSTAPWTSG